MQNRRFITAVALAMALGLVAMGGAWAAPRGTEEGVPLQPSSTLRTARQLEALTAGGLFDPMQAGRADDGARGMASSAERAVSGL